MEKVWFEGTVEEAIDKDFASEDTLFLVAMMKENLIKKISLSGNGLSNYGKVKIRMTTSEDESLGFVEIVEDDV